MSVLPAQIALDLHRAGYVDAAHKKIEDLHEYYASLVRLRRKGVFPDGPARAAREMSAYPEYRELSHKLLKLAIEHTAQFKSDEKVFAVAVEWVMRSIDASALAFDVRESLMRAFVDVLIPEPKKGTGYSPQELHLRAYQVGKVSELMFDQGFAKYVARYERAEALLYSRVADLLDEHGALATSNAEIRAGLLVAAHNVHRFVLDARPELVNPAHIEKFKEMSAAGEFQMDLAEIFPSSFVRFDPALPVHEWNPTYVRRGVPEPEKAWRKIARAVEKIADYYSEPPSNLVVGEESHSKGEILRYAQDDNQADHLDAVFKVYAAYAQWEVDRYASQKPRDTHVLENIAYAYKERMEQGEAPTALDESDVGRLPLYVQGIAKRLSQRERMVLCELLDIPSIKYAFARAEESFRAQGALSDASHRLVAATLEARGAHDAMNKRELYLYTLYHERMPLALKRIAAHNLSLSFKQEDTIARLIDAYRQSGDGIGEARLYERIVGFWELTGQIPDDYYLLVLDNAQANGASPIDHLRNIFENKRTEPCVLDIELRYGWQRYYGRLVDDMREYVDAGFRPTQQILHKKEMAEIFGELKDRPDVARALVCELRVRHQNRLEEIELAKSNLPNLFLKQPPLLRFLLLEFFKQLDGTTRQTLTHELQELEEAKTPAHAFRHFFTMTGLEKLGQTLSTLVGIVPDVDRRVFAQLQDRVPAGSVSEVRGVLERELGMKVSDKFASFDDTPVASASIAEIYSATLKEDGSTVYVKVIPPSKRRKILDTAERLEKVAASFEQQRERFGEGIDVAGMLRHFAQELRLQLDLRMEMRNAHTFEDIYGARVPAYLETTESVLIMRPVNGVKISALPRDAARRNAIATQVAEVGVRALLGGRYHADPHPGNLIVDESAGAVSWIDFGTMGTLTSQERKLFMEFLFSLSCDDVAVQLSALEALCARSESYTAIEAHTLESLFARLHGKELAAYLVGMLAAAGDHGLFLQRAYSQAIANLLTLKGVVEAVDPSVSITAVVGSYFSASYEDALRKAAYVEPGTTRSATKKGGSGSGSSQGGTAAPKTGPTSPPPPPLQNIEFSGVRRDADMAPTEPSRLAWTTDPVQAVARYSTQVGEPLPMPAQPMMLGGMQLMGATAMPMPSLRMPR